MSIMIRSVFTVLLLSASVLAHMALTFPVPLRSPENHFAVVANYDYTMIAPLSGAAQFPCKGYQSDLGSAAGSSVVTWTQGSSVNFTLAGSAVHGGGSCQAAISTDAGKTWYVIHTYQGGCPLAAGSFDLQIPADVPTGAALFGWTWFNQIGNREIYMNCASITIAKGSGTALTPFTSRPDLFVANLANGCQTVENGDVIIPNPGPDVTKGGSSKQLAVSGTCSPVSGIGGRASSGGSSGSGSGSGASSAAPAPVASSSAAASVMSSATMTTFVTAAPSSIATGTAPASIATGIPSGFKISVNGECGGTQTCIGNGNYQCCSSAGYCGNTDAYCGTGCMAAFGVCGINGTTSGSVRARHVRQFNF